MRRCLYQQCRIFANFNVQGSKTAIFCKKHAEDGMVNVLSKRCSHNACTKNAYFNVQSSKTAVYCKQHAEDGMVDVRTKRCLHDACTRRPSCSVEGRKKAVYCKQHAVDGMIDIRNKRCWHDSCMRYPSFNFKGNKTAAYCRQHAEDGMIDIHSKRCLYDSCTRIASFSVEGSSKRVYCKQHAVDGMVNVRSKRPPNFGRTPSPTGGVPTAVATTEVTRQENDSLPGVDSVSDSSHEVKNSLKRLTWEPDRVQAPHRVDHGPFEEGGAVQAAGMGPRKNIPHTLSPRTVPRNLHDNTVGTAARQTRGVMTKNVTPPPDDFPSGEAIKTEVGVDVLL